MSFPRYDGMFYEDSFFNFGIDDENDQSNKRKRDFDEDHYNNDDYNTKSQCVEIDSPFTLSEDAATDELLNARNTIAQLQHEKEQLCNIAINSNSGLMNALHRAEIFRAQTRILVDENKELVTENKELAAKIAALENELAALKQKPQEVASEEKPDSIFESSSVLLTPKRKHASWKGIDFTLILDEKRERTPTRKNKK